LHVSLQSKIIDVCQELSCSIFQDLDSNIDMVEKFAERFEQGQNLPQILQSFYDAKIEAAGCDVTVLMLMVFFN